MNNDLGRISIFWLPSASPIDTWPINLSGQIIYTSFDAEVKGKELL